MHWLCQGMLSWNKQMAISRRYATEIVMTVVRPSKGERAYVTLSRCFLVKSSVSR